MAVPPRRTARDDKLITDLKDCRTSLALHEWVKSETSQIGSHVHADSTSWSVGLVKISDWISKMPHRKNLES